MGLDHFFSASFLRSAVIQEREGRGLLVSERLFFSKKKKGLCVVGAPPTRKNHGGKKTQYSKVENDKRDEVYLLPVSAALLPPAAPWFVEIPYPFAAPSTSGRVTAVIRRCFWQLSPSRLHYSSSSVDPSVDFYR